jgi:hypothetical protein
VKLHEQRVEKLPEQLYKGEGKRRKGERRKKGRKG